VNDPAKPAKVRFHALAKGKRGAKFKELEILTLDGKGWSDCPADWRSPFLPEFAGEWADMVPLDTLIGYCGPGVTGGRTWIIAPDSQTLDLRWDALISERDTAKKEDLFHPTVRKDKTGAYQVADRHIRKTVSQAIGIRPAQPTQIVNETNRKPVLARYGFRSFDRQYIIADARVISDPRPKIWCIESKSQIYLTAPMDFSPSGGASANFHS
jgi:hypothetical protein